MNAGSPILALVKKAAGRRVGMQLWQQLRYWFQQSNKRLEAEDIGQVVVSWSLGAIVPAK